MTSSKNPAQMSEGQTLGFPPVGFANGGKPRQFLAPWRFVSLALFIQRRLILIESLLIFGGF